MFLFLYLCFPSTASFCYFDVNFFLPSPFLIFMSPYLPYILLAQGMNSSWLLCTGLSATSLQDCITTRLLSWSWSSFVHVVPKRSRQCLLLLTHKIGSCSNLSLVLGILGSPNHLKENRNSHEAGVKSFPSIQFSQYLIPFEMAREGP